MQWWTGSYPITFEKTNKSLGCGFIPVWHGTLSALDSLTASQLRPGDVATIYTGNGGHLHGVMWTGHDWRSDAIQRKANCYTSGSNQGEWASVLWRHPECQEPLLNDVKQWGGLGAGFACGDVGTGTSSTGGGAMISDNGETWSKAVNAGKRNKIAAKLASSWNVKMSSSSGGSTGDGSSSGDSSGGASGSYSGTTKASATTSCGANEALFVLYRYKKQSSSIDGCECLNGILFDNSTKNILCDTIESRHYTLTNTCDHPGVHKITVHSGGSWEMKNSHRAQANYAGKYKKKSDGSTGCMLSIDNSGCLFHMGQGACDTKGENAWTTGCVLCGCNPGGAGAFPNWSGTSGPGTANPDANASAWMNFYDHAYPIINGGKTLKLEIIENFTGTRP